MRFTQHDEDLMSRVFGIAQPDFGVGLTNAPVRLIVERQKQEFALNYGTNTSHLGGSLTGVSRLESVVRFPLSISDSFIVTEGYDATPGAAGSRPFLNPYLADFGIDGQWGQFSDTNPLPYRCDGIRTRAQFSQIERMRLHNIPGYAIVFNGAASDMESATQTCFEGVLSTINDVEVTASWGGVVVNETDAHVHDLQVRGVIDCGLVINGSSAYVRGGHIYGSQVAACKINATTFAEQVYWEAAPIGCWITGGADSTTINGLQFSPKNAGTCWGRGIKVEPSGCEITGITGSCFVPTVAHPTPVGIEVLDGTFRNKLQGKIYTPYDYSGGNQSTGGQLWNVLFGGSQSRLEFKGGGENYVHNSGYCKVTSAIVGSTIELDIKQNGGTVLDLSASSLDSTNGLGNKFVVNREGNATPIKYPGGGTTFNLAAGNRVFLNGVETYKNGLGDTYIDGVKQ